ncbi:YeeE/YedE family protein [Chitinimonas naiadis]
MHIDFQHFTPWQSLAGGLLIGLAAAACVLLLGRIMGVSGIVGGLFGIRDGAEWRWRGAFVAGLVVTPLLWRLFLPLPELTITASPLTLLLAGLLVGFGTRLAAGCTSGHGVCGLARLSPRSLWATGTFMTAGFITAYLVRHVAAVPL